MDTGNTNCLIYFFTLLFNFELYVAFVVVAIVEKATKEI